MLGLATYDEREHFESEWNPPVNGLLEDEITSILGQSVRLNVALEI